MYKIGIFTDTYTPQINGVVTVIRMMEKELARLGHKAFIFTPSHPDKSNLHPDRSENQPDAENIYRFPSVKFIFQPEYRVAIPYNRKASQLLPSLDVIHSHTPFSMGLLAHRTAAKYDLPHIHTYHTFYAEYRHYIPALFRPPRKLAETFSSYFCNRCHCVIAPSNEIKKELEGYGLETPIVTFPFGVDMERFQAKDEPKLNPANLFKIKKDEKIMLSVGRLGKEKNIDFLLTSFKHLLSYRNDVKLIIAGDGPERHKLKKKAQKDIGDKVIFTGYIEEELLNALYRKADIFVFASKTETQGIVILEAFASGTPVVCIGKMGVLDLMEDNKTGVLVNEDEEEFASACDRLLENRERRELMGKKARAKAFSMSSRHCTKELVKLYELLQNKVKRNKINEESIRI